MTVVLALTTASPRGGVALWRGGALLAAESYEDEKRHAERIFEVVRRVMDRAGVERASLDALACDIGPGSFTGVRVGLASAKGMALALDLPLVPVGSLEAMAAAAFAEADDDVELVAPLLDAKRGEMFLAVHRRDLELELAPQHAPAGEALTRLGALARHPGLRHCGRAAVNLGVAAERRIEATGCELPDAEWVARIAAERLQNGTVPDLASVEPAYLRAPDAKLPELARSPFV